MIYTLDVRVYNQWKMFFNFTGPEVMIYGPATYDEKMWTENVPGCL